MAELSSAAPTSGGVSLFSLHNMVLASDTDNRSYTSGRTLYHLPGVEIFLPGLLDVGLCGYLDEQRFNDLMTDANTIGSIASVGKVLVISCTIFRLVRPLDSIYRLGMCNANHGCSIHRI
jgi:hypothetical protein